MTPAELEQFLSELATEAGLSIEETSARFNNSFAPDDMLEAAIERIERRKQAAVALNQPVLTPCAKCRNYDNNPYLSCAVHPLERPGHECGDWGDNGSREAAKARVDAGRRARNAEREAGGMQIEVVSYDSGERVVLWQGQSNAQGQGRREGFAGSRWLPSETEVYYFGERAGAFESEEIQWQVMQSSDGTQHRFISSRTRYRHYPGGRCEIVPEEPVELPPSEQTYLTRPDGSRYGWPI